MDSSVRRSTRAKKVPTSYSPPPAEKLTAPGRGKKKAKCPKDVKKSDDKDYSFDVTPDGQPFTCDMCGSPYVIDPYKRKKTGITKRLLPRQRLDPVTGQHLMLCNACGIAKMRQIKSSHRPRVKSVISEEEKEQYLKEAKSFADRLVTNLGDTTAEKLYCPRFTSRPCRCIQTYLINGDDNDGYRQRAYYLINLIRHAQKYSSLKCYDINDITGPGGKKGKVGIGRGHKKSKVYEDFVMSRRAKLKNECNLCEVAIKKILCYSNNFLFKKLKSQESECRIEKVKGRGKKTASLIPIEKLAQEKCCHGKCTVMALSHMTLLQEWRDRAGKGQTEARRVIAEMLTPSGLHTNCYAFIRMVTGVTSSVISSVNNYMRETGGRRDPPPHGLKIFWENHPKRRKLDNKTDNVSSQDSVVEVVVSGPDTDQSVVSDQRKSVLITSNKSVDVTPDGVTVLAGGDYQGKAICLSDVSQTTDQASSNHGSATNVMVLESAATLGNPDDHLELIPFCNSDGSTQLLQVPIIAYSNLEGDNLLQDLNLQIPVDPGSLILDNSSSFLDNNGIILDVPTLSHTVLQNPTGMRNQVIQEFQTTGMRATSPDTNTLKEGAQSNDAQMQDPIITQGSFGGTPKSEMKMIDVEQQYVVQNRESDIRNAVQTTLPQMIFSGVADTKQPDLASSGNLDESMVKGLGYNDCQLAEFSISKDGSVVSFKNPYPVGTSQQLSAETFYKIQTLSSNELSCSVSSGEPALQGETMYMDSRKTLPLTLRSVQCTSSLLYPPNAEVLSTRNFDSLPSSAINTSKYVISSVNSPSTGDTTKLISQTLSCITVPVQQKPSVSAAIQTTAAEVTHLGSLAVTAEKDSKMNSLSNSSLLVPKQVIAVSCSASTLESENATVVARNTLGIMPTSDVIKQMLWPSTVAKSEFVMGQSDIIHSSRQEVSRALMSQQKPTQSVLTIKESATPVKCTSVADISSLRLTSTTKPQIVTKRTTTTTTVAAHIPPGKTVTTAVRMTSTGEKTQTGFCKTGTFLQTKQSECGAFSSSVRQPVILPKPAPGDILTTRLPSELSVPVSVLNVSTAAPSRVVLSTGSVQSSVPGLMLSSLVNPIPQFVMPVVKNKNTVKAANGQISEHTQTNSTAAAAAAAVPKTATSIQGLQFASGNTIILHNAASQKGGSFSLQHLANQRTGSVAVEHGQGSVYITRAPNSDIQFIQPIVPRLLVPPPVEQIRSVHQAASSVMTVPVRQALAPIGTDQQLLQTVTAMLPTTNISSKQHLKDLLPVLPTADTRKTNKS